jgi:predicted transcriptional regulator
VGYRTSEYAIMRSLELLRVLLAIEAREPSVMDIVHASGLNFKTVQKYINILAKLGLVTLEPTERKNIVRLTERGRCVARCLVS